MGRINILAYGYREWALDIFNNLQMFGYNIQVEKNPDRVNESVIQDFKPDMLLFYGWSWKVPEWIVDKYMALCLHPSPLPKYRGGSPIQNQILNGEKESSVSIFRLTRGVDEGPLCAQVKYSLEGNMTEILSRIRNIGTEESRRVIDEFTNGGINFWDQSGSVLVYKRRSPEDSLINKWELHNKPAEYLYNKIRSLQDPYPNAYIECADGKRLYITEAYCE